MIDSLGGLIPQVYCLDATTQPLPPGAALACDASAPVLDILVSLLNNGGSGEMASVFIDVNGRQSGIALI